MVFSDEIENAIPKFPLIGAKQFPEFSLVRPGALH